MSEWSLCSIIWFLYLDWFERFPKEYKDPVSKSSEWKRTPNLICWVIVISLIIFVSSNLTIYQKISVKDIPKNRSNWGIYNS